MKLLFDQNISHRIITKLDKRFENCKQVRHVGLEDCTDMDIWKFARQHEFSIVTFDSDFYDISLINGFPPKIIWLRKGNMTTAEIVNVFLTLHLVIKDFLQNSSQACLEIE